MKARLPKGYSNGGGATNIQQLARQAQKMQEEMDAATKELEEKEYTSTVGGCTVTAIVTGKLEIKSLDIKKDVVDPEDIDMASRMKEDLGLDSLTLITMVDEAERRFNIVIRDEQLMSIRTIGDVVRSIDEQTRS